MLKISVAICTYNREKYLPTLLASVARQTLPRDQFEVLLINNNSPGDTEGIATSFSNENPSMTFRYFLETNQGLSFARNRSIREAKAPFITFLDDDAYIADNYLEVIVNYFESHEHVVAIGSKILLDYEGGKPPKWGNKYLNPLLGYFNLGDKEMDFPRSNYPRGSNMSFRMLVFSAVGLFNENLGRIGKTMISGEEKDLFHRIYQSTQHRVVYIPGALVYHAVPIERTTVEFIRKQAIGQGISERLRTYSIGKSEFRKALLKEAMKWCASFALLVYYYSTFRFAKGNMLIVFRYWVIRGMLNKHLNG